MGYATIAMAGLQALGSIMQGNASAGAANFNAKVADQNAQLATQKAAWAGAEGEQKVGIAGLQAKQTQGNIKVAQATNNVDVNSGSALAVQQSQRQAAQLNLANIRSNAAREAFGYETQAVGYRNQASLDRASAKNARMAGYVGAVTNVAKGAAAYSMYGGDSGEMFTPHVDNPSATPLYNSFLSQSGGSNWNTQASTNSLFPD